VRNRHGNMTAKEPNHLAVADRFGFSFSHGDGRALKVSLPGNEVGLKGDSNREISALL